MLFVYPFKLFNGMVSHVLTISGEDSFNFQVKSTISQLHINSNLCVELVIRIL